MWRYAMARVRRPEIAEELIQETFLAALRSHESFRGESSERTWLLSILRHKMVDHIRRRRKEEPIEDGAGERSAPTNPMMEMFDQKGRWRFDPGRGPGDGALESPEFMADFARCLEKLPAGMAEAFVMREVRGSAAEAICAALQITLDNLWVRLHRARVLLRRCLARKWTPAGKAGC
jgi:RNA polymerase sigma-70 factor (TIGR02943 family)